MTRRVTLCIVFEAGKLEFFLTKDAHLWQSKCHPGSKVEIVFRELGGEEADKDEVWGSPWLKVFLR